MVRPNGSKGDRSGGSVSPLGSILALAGGAVALPLGGLAEGDIIVNGGGSQSLNGDLVSWTGSGHQRSVSVDTNFGGLLGTNGGFRIQTRATNYGAASFGNFVGVGVAWHGTGSGQFARSIVYGQDAAHLFQKDAPGDFSQHGNFANINLGFLVGGYFSNVGNPAFNSPSKYLMFNFSGTGGTYYGWIEIMSMTGSGPTNNYSVTLGDWAYSNVANTPILAGETGSAAVPEVDPAGAAGALALAAGVLGLLERRRKAATEAMGGALVAGASGLRRYRRERAASASPATSA